MRSRNNDVNNVVKKNNIDKTSAVDHIHMKFTQCNEKELKLVKPAWAIYLRL